MPRRPRLSSLLLLAAFAMLGCHAQGPYAPASAADRNPLRAQELTLEAVPLMDTNPKKAEEILREALTADLFHGPAHNDLGVLFLKQGKLYEAASEFEWSKKLMPGHPDPRVNLALTLERAGRTDDALNAYASALEVYPDYIGALEGMTSLELRTGKVKEHTRAHLQAIAMRGETPKWQAWAREREALMNPAAPAPKTP